jgi:hypothetical protein
MRANPLVRSALLASLKITRQGLHERTRKLKSSLPMSTEDAVYVLAHQNGIDIGRYLDRAALDRVGAIVSRLGNGPDEPRRVKKQLAGTTQTTVRIVLGPIFDADLPGLARAHAADARRMTAEVYPVLYLFENSARDLIDGVLTSRIGPNWWELSAPTDLKKKVQKRLTDESADPWHGKRGGRPISYLDITDLPVLVRKHWPIFKDKFPRETWFTGVVDDLNISRRVVAHMNPLEKDEIAQVHAGFRKWIKQVQAIGPQVTAPLPGRAPSV